MGNKQFEKAFRKAVFNFNDSICNFIFQKGSNEVFLKFILNNKLVTFRCYKDQYYIDLWKNHFIDFFETGNFDYNGYWKIYGGSGKDDVFVDDKIYKIPLCSRFGRDFCEHHESKLKNLYAIKHPDLGIKLIPKPINGESIIEFD